MKHIAIHSFISMTFPLLLSSFLFSTMADSPPGEWKMSQANRPMLSGTEYTLDSSSGYFKIHWTDSGSDSTTADYALSIAQAADSSREVQCVQLGFFQPPPDNDAGGDDKYDIYLLGLTAGTTGYMSQAGEYMPPDSTHDCSASHICVSTSLAGLDTRNCIVANLFAQAVGAAYDYSEAVSFLMCYSAWMEELVFPSANHYLEYLQQENPLENPWKGLGTLGSSDFPWVWMAGERWGSQSVRRIWEICAEQPGANTYTALEGMLSEQGTTLEEFLMDYGAWRWFTADNWFAGCGMYGPDAALWQPGPCVLPVHEINTLPDTGTSAAGYEPEEKGLNWIRLDLTSYMEQWIEFSFDGCDNTQWSLGVILQDQSDSLYFNWYHCDPSTGEKTVAVNSANWDCAIFFPACFDPGAPANTYSYSVVSQGTGIGNPGGNGDRLNLRFSSNPMRSGGEISFDMPAQGFARIVMYDLAGRIAAVLMNEEKGPGTHTLQMNRSELETGTYFILLSTESITEGRKLVLIN